MKSSLFIALSLCPLIIACSKKSNDPSPVHQTSLGGGHQASGRSYFDSSNAATSVFINTDIANTMISSYLYSIGSSQNDSDIRSFSVNADSLRAYLADSSIKNLKLMFAHTVGYINAGNNGVNAGYQSGAMTIIIAAYDGQGKYIYHNGCVLDHLAPCPYTCPPGSAANALLD